MCNYSPAMTHQIHTVLGVLEISGPVDVDKLLPDIKDLKLNFQDNVSLLSKPTVVDIIKPDDSDDRFEYIPAFIQSTDLFFYIWRNSYLRKQVIYRIKQSDDIYYHSKRIVSTSTTLLINQNRSSLKPKTISSTVTNIIVDPRILTRVKSSIPDNVAELLKSGDNGIYYVHIKSKKIPLDVTHLIWTMNSVIPPGYLDQHKQLKSITFNHVFNQPILDNSIPDSVTSLRFGIEFQMDLEFINFPSNLKELYLCASYDRVIKPNILPPTLRIFEIGYKSNVNNDYSFLPSSCHHLILLLPNPVKNYIQI